MNRKTAEILEKAKDSIVGHDETARRHRKTGTLSTLIATVLSSGILTTIAAGFWEKGIKPELVDGVVAAAAEDLDTKVTTAVQTQVAPLKLSIDASNSGLKAIIISRIDFLKEDIDKLEYIRDFRASDWTAEKRAELFERKGQLDIQQSALADIETAEALAENPNLAHRRR